MKIITIGRQFGSGGHEIGKTLAERMNMRFFDKDLISLAAKEGGFSEKILREADEKPASSLLYSMVTSLGRSDAGMSCLPLNDRLFIAQSKIIKRLAAEADCIIVGRCADYILRGNPDCINVFIHAPLNARIKRICKRYNLSEKDAEIKILKTDKSRANYVNHYSDHRWGRVDDYHLTLDSAAIGIDNAVKLIADFVELYRPGENHNV